MTYCVTAAMRDTPTPDAKAILRERVLRPIGVADKEWSAGYGKPSVVDGLTLYGSWGGAAFMPRAAAKVGRLMLRQGDWEGRRILSKEAVRAVTSDAGQPGHCGMGWWSNGGGRFAGVPKDAYYGAGAGDQLVLVVPSLNLIDRLQPGGFRPRAGALPRRARGLAGARPSGALTRFCGRG